MSQLGREPPFALPDPTHPDTYAAGGIAFWIITLALFAAS